MTAGPARQTFRLPDLGEGLTEAEVIEWRVAVGDRVHVDQVVVEVETAKAAVEVPVPLAGTVLELHAGAGSVVDVGAPLISVGVEDPAADRYRREEQAGSGNVLVGYGTGRVPAGGRRPRGRTAARAVPTPRTAPPAAPRDGLAVRVISPLVRRLAREHGLPLTAIPTSEPDGVIRRRDVEAALADRPAARPEPGPELPGDQDAEQRIPLRGVRRAITEKLVRSRAEIPDATTWVDVDATGLLAARDTLAAGPRRVGLLALLARIAIAGLGRFPDLNASVDTERDEIVRHRHINLGFAAQTDRGLMAPVVRAAHAMTTAQISAEITRLTELARTGHLPPESLTGGTFTLNNYGVFGVDGSAAIINHPEAAILGIGRIVDKPWVVDGELRVRKVTQLSLSFDHRVCDGGAAGGFLRYVADCVEDPYALLADV